MDGTTANDSLGQPPVLPTRRSRAPSLSGIERFTLIKRLGEGGMGSVYEAYDAALDRKVALKLVRADRRRHARGTLAGDQQHDPLDPRDQLLREAQAMGRLAHPHVVAVHEVGEIKDDVYVILELVDGTTLRDWLRERPRTWREILGVYEQAGRGLAAAHEAGLVHRDFKPTNALIRRDGRVLVADFGVASLGGACRDSASSLFAAGSAPGDITFVGRRVGTLAYMAPEQYALGAVDARADQFSFCVALWEALYGERPFETTALLDAPPRAPATARVPRWLERVLLRGLAMRAADRWPSMDALLAELGRDRARARRRRLAIAGVTTLVLAASLGWARAAHELAGLRAQASVPMEIAGSRK